MCLKRYINFCLHICFAYFYYLCIHIFYIFISLLFIHYMFYLFVMYLLIIYWMFSYDSYFLVPRKSGKPLLSKLSERVPEPLDYLSVSYGLTLPLLKFWCRAGYIPLYIRWGKPCDEMNLSHSDKRNNWSVMFSLQLHSSSKFQTIHPSIHFGDTVWREGCFTMKHHRYIIYFLLWLFSISLVQTLLSLCFPETEDRYEHDK